MRQAGTLLLLALVYSSYSAAPATAQNFDVRSYRPWAGYAIPNGTWHEGDFDGDGRVDILHAVANTDYVHIWRSNGDGTYTMGSFSPWPGYAISNGQLLLGDFDGDGRTDIVHPINNTDYVHVWTSVGNFGFNVGTFRAWPGYSIPNGVWLTGDFNGDGRTDVFHGVQSNGVANVWLSLGRGAFNVRSFQPWAGYAIPNGQWLVGDFNGDGRADVVHAVNATDYVHVWTSRGDGTFGVGSFRPWAGYAVPNGKWLVGDFNGDGRSDILHPVDNSSFANTWLSNGTGTFAVSAFTPWAGYSIPNGQWFVGDYDHDGRSDVLHAVASADYAHVWTSRGNGTYAVSTFRPWAGYAMSGQMLIADVNDDGKDDLIHPVPGADYANTWLAAPPSPALVAGNVSVESLEFVQAIQDEGHRMPLIADKETYARAYLSVSSASPIDVSGSLQVRDPATGASTTLTSIGAARLEQSRNGKLSLKRDQLSLSLNFAIPPRFRGAGVRTLQLTSVRDNPSGATRACVNCQGNRQSGKFVNSSHLRVRVVGLTYTTGTPPNLVVRAPQQLDYDRLNSWLRRAYPVSQIITSRLVLASNTGGIPDCGQANAQLAMLRAAEISGGADNRTHYYGLVSDAGSFMRGCASGIPNAPDPTVVASGPTGPNGYGDPDGSYGDWYGGHELAHTFGRLHPGFCGESVDDLTRFPFANAGRISHPDAHVVGFDFGDVGGGIAPAALASASTFDVMTYCAQPQWLSSYTYQGVRARLMLENPAFNANPGAPNLRDAALLVARADTTPPKTRETFFVDTVPLADPEKKRQQPAASANAAGDSPKPPGPPTPHTGRAQPPRITTGAVAAAVPQELYETAPPIVQGGSARTQPAPSLKAPPALAFTDSADQSSLDSKTKDRHVTPQRGKFLSVIATLNMTKKTGSIATTSVVQRATTTNEEQNKNAILRFYDASNVLLAEHGVWLRENTDTPRNEDRTALVDAVVPLPEGARALELWSAGARLDRKEFGTAGPTMQPPKWESAPARGATDGKASDAEPAGVLRWEPAAATQNQTIRYQVEASTNAGKTWQVLAVGLSTPELMLSPSQLRELGGKPLVRVIASDGINTSTARAVRVGTTGPSR